MSVSLDIQDLPGEKWEIVTGYSGNYHVSNKGRVKSFIKGKPQILKKTKSDGKYKVQLFYRIGKFNNQLIGRLVCSAFNGLPGENDVIAYRDGNRLNDDAENVYWVTKRESVITARNRGKYSHPGSSNGMAKLTPEKVESIKIYKAGGKSSVWISRQYGVSRDAIDSIVKGRTWKNV